MVGPFTYAINMGVPFHVRGQIEAKVTVFFDLFDWGAIKEEGWLWCGVKSKVLSILKIISHCFAQLKILP